MKRRGDLSGRNKLGMRCVGEVIEGVKEGKCNIDGYLRIPMEIYYFKGFLKYVHIWKKYKWIH